MLSAGKWAYLMQDDDGSAFAGQAHTGPADALALATAAPLDPRAVAYLEEQTALTRLQKKLVEQNAFELSHVRWRRLNEVHWWTTCGHEARAQFETAKRLDLTPAEKLELMKLEAARG